MKQINKNKQIENVINILVCTDKQDLLWKYRDLLYKIFETSKCKMDLILTARIDTALEISGFIAGGIDIYITEYHTYKKEMKYLENKIRERYPESYIIVSEESKKAIVDLSIEKKIRRVVKKLEVI